MTDAQVSKAPARSRYEAHIAGELAGYSDYRVSDGVVAFTHAEVFPEHGGQGIASEMARVSLDEARAEGSRRFRPVCPFYVWYVEQHLEYADLVA